MRSRPGADAADLEILENMQAEKKVGGEDDGVSVRYLDIRFFEERDS